MIKSKYDKYKIRKSFTFNLYFFLILHFFMVSISQERETYLIESKHTDSIEEADAIIVCNPDGYIGSRTLYEIGYADSRGKRIIFLYKEQDEFDICFPRDYGLIDFEM